MNKIIECIPNFSEGRDAEKIEKIEGHIDFSKSAEEIALRVRAMTPVPGAYIIGDGERIGITAARALDPDAGINKAYDTAPHGTVLDISNRGIAVQAGEGVVLIEAIKMPGRKAMPVAEYLKGNTFDYMSL